MRGSFNIQMNHDTTTAWKVSKYGVIPGPYFPVFGLNTEIFRIQFEYRKIRTRNNSIFGHFSRSAWPKSYPCDFIMRLVFVEGKSFSKFGIFVKNNVTQGGEIYVFFQFFNWKWQRHWGHWQFCKILISYLINFPKFSMVSFLFHFTTTWLFKFSIRTKVLEWQQRNSNPQPLSS